MKLAGFYGDQASTQCFTEKYRHSRFMRICSRRYCS